MLLFMENQRKRINISNNTRIDMKETDYKLSKDDFDFLRDCAGVLKTFGFDSYAERLVNLCPPLGDDWKEKASTPIR